MRFLCDVGRLRPAQALPIVVAASVAVAAWAPPARACSICRCGDPTFNALGKDSYGIRGLRLALDTERFDKEQGDPSVGAESQVEERLTALVSFSPIERIQLFARLPYSNRNLTSSEPTLPETKLHTDGFSDPELYAQVRLWSADFSGGLGQRSSLALSFGVKTPWGRNDVTRDGARLDEHAQPGTGATDLFGNLSLLHLIDKRSALFASAGFRHTGRNRYGYRYGSSFLANATYEHKLGARLDGVIELDFRQAARDAVDSLGTLDGDTGGALLYATPKLLVSLGRGLVLRAAAQIPVARWLNGFQKERAVLNIGVTYLLSR